MITSVVPKLPFIDKKQTVNFYTQRLGFELMSDYGDYVIMRREGAELHFFSYPALEPTKSDFMIYLRIDDGIEQVYEQLQHQQPAIERLHRLETKPWGQQEFALIDRMARCLLLGSP